MTNMKNSFLILLFYTGNTLFGEIWSHILKFSVSAKIWSLKFHSNMLRLTVVFTFSVFDLQFLSKKSSLSIFSRIKKRWWFLKQAHNSSKKRTFGPTMFLQRFKLNVILTLNNFRKLSKLKLTICVSKHVFPVRTLSKYILRLKTAKKKC